jgi:tetratricopeptide (TPR) repeat protein
MPAVAQVANDKAQNPPSTTAPSSILRAPSAPSSGNVPITAPVAQQSATAAPQEPLSPEAEGDLLQAQKRYQAAIAAYKDVQPPKATVSNKMGIAYQMMFNLKDAERCYREALKQDSKNATIMNNLATVYQSEKKYGQAEKTYRKALKTSPKSAIIYKNLGTNLMVQKKYNKGMEAYREAMAIDPQIFQDRSGPRVSDPTNVQDRGAINYYMALGCVRAGQTDCAIEYLRAALNQGYVTAKKLSSDEDFLILHDNPAFQALLAAQEKQANQPQKQ